MRKEKRGGRLLIDVMRNAYGQAAVAPYSVRAFAGAPVAMPLAWHDLERGLIGPRTFTIRKVNEYLHINGEPWSGMSRQARSIKRARKRLLTVLQRPVSFAVGYHLDDVILIGYSLGVPGDARSSI
jgi:bifunctional non-homologous end joining protein LigD